MKAKTKAARRKSAPKAEALPVLEGAGFVLKDPDGVVRADLGFDPMGCAMLTLYDAQRRPWLQLECPPYGGAKVELWDGRGEAIEPEISLSLSANGTSEIQQREAVVR